MSTNASSAAEAQAAAAKAPPIPKGYTKWFVVEFKDIIFDPSILHRKAAIEGYYIGIVTGYNTLRGKKYSILFEWMEVPSELPNCKDFTLHVYINPPPTVIRKAVTTSALAAADTGMGGTGERDEIDPPTPPPPPPPTM